MRATSRAVSSRDPHPSVAEEVLGELPLDPLGRRLHRRQQIADGADAADADSSDDDAAAAAGAAEAAHVSAVTVVAGAVHAVHDLRYVALEFHLVQGRPSGHGTLFVDMKLKVFLVQVQTFL